MNPNLFCFIDEFPQDVVAFDAPGDFFALEENQETGDSTLTTLEVAITRFS